MWDKVTLGFDVEEETVNFGCRKMAICDSAVYETNTLAIFSTENEEEDTSSFEAVPKVTCLSYSGTESGIIVSINESLTILNESGNEMRNRCSFNAHVDCFAVTPTGSLLFTALNNGDIHCFLLNSNRNHILLKNICSPLADSKNTFAGMVVHHKQEKCELILASLTGTIYSLKELDLPELIQTCMSPTADNIRRTTEKIVIDSNTINKSLDDNTKVILFQEFKRHRESMVIILVQVCDKQELQLWSSENKFIDSLCLPSNCKLKKIQVAKSGSLIYGLTLRKSILVICPYTLNIIFHQTKLILEDFEFLNDEEDNLLVITNENSGQLKLISVPGFKVKFQLDVSPSTFLAKNQTSLEDLLYLEGMINEASSKTAVTSIHLKAISESQPEYRLERILRRGKFEEAEEFARSFNLDVEIVYKAHLQTLSSDIQPWSTSSDSLEQRGLKFKSLLQKITDMEFIGKCAVNVLSSDFTLMKDVLNYAENKFREYFKEKKSIVSSVLQQLYNKIRDTLLRLSTFVTISEKPFTADKWLTFGKANLIDECQSLLQQGFLNKVILIWSRHVHELKERLSVEQALSFLKTIPSSVEIGQILHWLRIFLPECLKLFPQLLKSIVSWCKEKISLMELHAEADWPDNGVLFLKKLLKLLRQNVLPCKISSENIIQSEFDEESPIKAILFYIKILTEMSAMKKGYGILVTIAEYTQENNEEVIFTILDKVPVKELQPFFNTFLDNLMAEKGLHSDLVISRYIKCLVEGSVNWWYWEEAPWEGRVAELLHCITSVQERLKCVLCILKHSPVPWSSIVTNICEESLKLKSPLIQSISEQKKLVNCKLILKKYDLKDNSLTKPQVHRIILYIFSQARNSMLEDSLQIADTFDIEMCTEVYKLYTEYLVEKRDSHEVLSFLESDTLPLETVIKCCERVILKTHCLSIRNCCKEKYQKYVEMLHTVEAKLNKAVSKLNNNGQPRMTVISPGICKKLKSVHYLKKNYNVDITNKNSCRQGEQDQLLNCLQSILKKMLADPSVLEKESLKLTELSNCFEYTKEEIFVKFINIVLSQNETSTALQLAKSLVREDEFSIKVSKSLINLAVSVLENCVCNREFLNDNQVAGVLHQLVVSGLNSCPSGTLAKGIEISNWCKLVQCSMYSDFLDKNFVGDTASATYVQNISFSTLLNLLSLYWSYLNENNIKTNLHSMVEQESNQSMETEQIRLLPACLQDMIKNEPEQICFQTIATLHWSLVHNCFMSERPLNESTLIVVTKNFCGQSISKLLKKLIGSRYLDCQFGIALLHYFPVKEASAWILESTKRFRHDFQRLYAITELGMVYFHENKCNEQWNTILKLRKQCVWGKQIMTYGFSYKEAFRDTQNDHRTLLYKLMSVSTVNVDVLRKYCRDMNFDFQGCLKVYLKQLLQNWEPEFEIKTDSVTSEKTLFVKPTHVKLLQKCREISSLIENTNEFYSLIVSTIWNVVNYYYYEIYLILITLLEERGIKLDVVQYSIYRTIFLFLSSYQRISKAQEKEKENWFQLYPNEQSLPAIAEYRLPFKMIYAKFYKEPWKIIKPELNMNTYTKWFAVLDALELDKDVLCSMTINQILCDEMIIEKSTSEWCIHPRNQKLLADIKTCVDHIKSREMSCASLYFVVNNLPPGVDQVTAATLCYTYTKQWKEAEKSTDAETRFQKAHNKYLIIATTHILYLHNLGKPQYLQLVSHPQELVNAIYNDPIILEKNTGDVTVIPDINKAAEEICKLHKVNVSSIRMELLEEWLQPENFIGNNSCDETMIRHHNGDCVTEEKISNIEYQNFQRACYLIEREIQNFGPYLVGIIFDQNLEDSKPISVRLRALQCLYAVTSEDNLETITKQFTGDLRILMNTLKYVMELEMLGLTFSVPVFESSDKTEIVKSLLSLKNPKAISLAASICRSYQIRTPDIWNRILFRMCSYEMVEELAKILPELSGDYHTLDLSVFEKAWSTVLLLPVEKAHPTPSEEIMEMIEKSIELIYFCPIIDQINVQSIVKNCERIRRTDLTNVINKICLNL